MRIEKMENQQEPNLKKVELDNPDLRKEIDKKKNDLIIELKPSELQKDISKSTPLVGEILGDLFYNSIKLYFDIGFNLAKRLNFDLIIDSIKKAQKEKEEEKAI
jgi:hypothetical protein